eukprot:6209525-Pleurochrysis_carterae.AAC.3
MRERATRRDARGAADARQPRQADPRGALRWQVRRRGREASHQGARARASSCASSTASSCQPTFDTA